MSVYILKFRMVYCRKYDNYLDDVIKQCQNVLSNIEKQIETIQQGLINDEQELKYIADNLEVQVLIRQKRGIF